jgi:chromosome segregation ATPase
MYRAADDLFHIKITLEKKYDSYSLQAKQYEKQYNGAKTALALAQTSYSLCKSNCNGILQNIRNITNNLNNLIGKMNAVNSEMNSIHDQLDGISSKLYALDREAREFVPKVKKYFTDNLKNGTISDKK